MKKTFFIFIISLLPTTANGQKDTVGLFYNYNFFGSFRIILFNDETYKILRPAQCLTAAQSEIGSYKVSNDTMITFSFNTVTFYGKLVNEQLSLKKDLPDTLSHYKNRRKFVGKFIRYYDDLFTIKYFYNNNRLKTNCTLKYKRGEYNKTEYRDFYESGAIKSNGTLYKRYRFGKWIYYSEGGEIIKKEKWKNGVLVN